MRRMCRHNFKTEMTFSRHCVYLHMSWMASSAYIEITVIPAAMVESVCWLDLTEK